MRILMLCYEYPPLGGGGGRVVQGLSKELARRGHLVDVVTMGFRGLPSREDVQGVRIHRVPALRARMDRCSKLEAFSHLLTALPVALRLARRNRYDLNHTHFIFPDGYLALLLRRLVGLPYVVTAHGSDVPGYNPERLMLAHRILTPLWRRIVGGARRIVCPSRTLERLVLERAPGAPTRVIPNGIALADWNSPRATEDTRAGILIVTRMLERKGVQYALRALDVLAPREPVRIVGDGPYLPALKRLAQELQVPVEFIGWLDNGSAELRRLYESAGIFVLPSEVENFPVVLLEAMAAGLAIVTTSGTGCAEVVGDAALLVPPKDEAAIRAALEHLEGDPSLCRHLGEKARARLEQHFTWAVVGNQHEALYHEDARPATP